MSTPFQSLLSTYSCQTQNDYINAVHEIIQEIALVGLSRAKFFEHAAFYGGTALRILYGLDRFSEDLDFSLLQPQSDFSLHSYLSGVQEELKGFGVNGTIEHKTKAHPSSILSAFLKANTMETFLLIDLPEQERRKITHNQKFKIKFEIDTDPPPAFETEVKFLLRPIPFSVKSFTLPNLFAGKMHALLFRKWEIRVKGRDWYDFVWFVSNQVPLHLAHLEMRMRQTNQWKERLTPEIFRSLLEDKINHLPIDLAKEDVVPFLRDRKKIDVWSKEFFLSLVSRVSFSS